MEQNTQPKQTSEQYTNTSLNSQINTRTKEDSFVKVIVFISTASLLSLLFFFQLSQFGMGKLGMQSKIQKSMTQVQWLINQNKAKSKFGINNQLSNINTGLFEQSSSNYLTQKTLIFQVILMSNKRIISLLQSMHTNQEGFFNYIKNHYNKDMQIVFKNGHMTQLDQNIHTKVHNFINNRDTNSLYLQEIMQNLEGLNFGQQCTFLKTDCHNYKLFIFDGKADDLINKTDNLKYTKYKNSFLIVNQLQNNRQIQKRTINMVNTKITEIILSQLGLASLIQLCVQKNMPITQIDQIFDQIVIHEGLVNFKEALTYVNQTLSFKEALTYMNSSFTAQSYELIDQKLELLQNITESQYGQVNKSGQNKSAVVQQIRELKLNLELIRQNNLDWFPSDYKLGVFLPLIVIIVYPLFYYIKQTITIRMFSK